MEIVITLQNMVLTTYYMVFWFLKNDYQKHLLQKKLSCIYNENPYSLSELLLIPFEIFFPCACEWIYWWFLMFYWIHVDADETRVQIERAQLCLFRCCRMVSMASKMLLDSILGIFIASLSPVFVVPYWTCSHLTLTF